MSAYKLFLLKTVIIPQGIGTHHNQGFRSHEGLHLYYSFHWPTIYCWLQLLLSQSAWPGKGVLGIVVLQHMEDQELPTLGVDFLHQKGGRRGEIDEFFFHASYIIKLSKSFTYTSISESNRLVLAQRQNSINIPGRWACRSEGMFPTHVLWKARLNMPNWKKY